MAGIFQRIRVLTTYPVKAVERISSTSARSASLSSMQRNQEWTSKATVFVNVESVATTSVFFPTAGDETVYRRLHVSIGYTFAQFLVDRNQVGRNFD